ncbi:MAG: hypothetical protein OEV92_01705 [Nitrospinota bacterium]|nr:hypothetical protein [Nitrospinota bacterium]
MAGKYPFKPADFSRIKSHSIQGRKSLVNAGMLADLAGYRSSGRLADLLPPILKGADLLRLARAIKQARAQGKTVVAAMGAHVIKCGLSPIIIDLMERRVLCALAVNGAFLIHDLELAFHGATSEDVAQEIKQGRFGMVGETSEHYNRAIAAAGPGMGLGAAMGRYISEGKMPHTALSVLAAGWRLDIPITVHVAMGTDITHAHPGADGAAIGQASLEDFRLFTGVVSSLSGGVYLNIGSAVVMPEVFIKALSAARNIGTKVEDFTAVNMDMIQGYRPNVNVVNRPVEGAGQGYSITGHHEIMIPLLYHLLREEGAF